MAVDVHRALSDPTDSCRTRCGFVRSMGWHANVGDPAGAQRWFGQEGLAHCAITFEGNFDGRRPGDGRCAAWRQWEDVLSGPKGASGGWTRGRRPTRPRVRERDESRRTQRSRGGTWGVELRCCEVSGWSERGDGGVRREGQSGCWTKSGRRKVELTSIGPPRASVPAWSPLVSYKLAAPRGASWLTLPTLRLR